jgi:hypothetical protein
MLALCSSIACAQSEVQARLIHVLQAQQTQATYDVSSQTRLSEVIQALTDVTSQDWRTARFGSRQLQFRLQRLKLETQQRLTALQHYAEQEGDEGLALTAKQLQRQLQNSRFLAAYYLGVPWHGMRLRQANNPALNDSYGSDEFYLSLYSTETSKSVELFGALNSPISRVLQPAGSNNDIKQVVAAHKPQQAANQGYVWQININGGVVKQPIAYFNQGKVAQCYSHQVHDPLRLGKPTDCSAPQQLSGGQRLYVGIDESQLPQSLQGINERMVRLLKFHVPHEQPLPEWSH